MCVPLTFNAGHVRTNFHLWNVDGLVFDVYVILKIGKTQLAQSFIIQITVKFFHRLEVVQLSVLYRSADITDKSFLEKV